MVNLEVHELIVTTPPPRLPFPQESQQLLVVVLTHHIMHAHQIGGVDGIAYPSEACWAPVLTTIWQQVKIIHFPQALGAL